MAQATAVVTDSLACLSPELAAEFNIKVIPLGFIFKDKTYRDWVDITPTRAYEMFLEKPEAFQTTAPSPVEFINAFREVGVSYQNILCVTISSKLSTTFNTACMAKEQVESETPGIKIEILDSKTVTSAEGLVALAAARAAAKGVSLDEAAAEAGKVAEHVSFFALVDTIRHVYRSGRIPKIASQLGAVLNVKPILVVTPESDGKVNFTGVVRSRTKGVSRMLEGMIERVDDKPVHVAIMHAYALKRAEELRDIIAAKFNCKELWIGEFSPLMGYATGTDTLGIAFYAD